MANLSLNASNYIDNRWEPSYQRFDREAKVNYWLSNGFTGLILFASVGALVAGNLNESAQWLLFGLALVAIALFVLYDFRGKSQRARDIADALQREHEMYKGKVGVYENTAQAMTRFMQRCESIMLAENGLYLPLMLPDDKSTKSSSASSSFSRSRPNPPGSPFGSRFGGSSSPRSGSPFGSRTPSSSKDEDLSYEDDDDDEESGTAGRSPFSSGFSSGGSRRPSSGGSSSPFSGRSSGSSDSPFGSRSSGSSGSPFSRSSGSSSPFGGRSSSGSAFGRSGSSSNPPRAGSTSVGGMHRDGEDDPALDKLSGGSANNGVRFAAYYPKEMGTKDWVPMKAYTFIGYALDAVKADAQGNGADKLPEVLYDRNHTSRYRIPEGATVTVTPHMPGFQFNPQNISIGFYRTWHRFDFEIRAVEAELDEATNGHLTFTVDGLIIADVPMSIYVSKSLDKAKQHEIRYIIRKPYSNVYVSLADADAYLAKRFETIFESLGMYNMRDIVQTRQQDGWNEDLMKAVDTADVFQLFWSASAADSDIVQQEIARALARDAVNRRFLRAVYWEQPAAALPESLDKVELTYMPDLANLGQE